MAAIKVQGVHKKFRVYYDKGRSLKEKVLFQNRNHYEERWVLRGIDFEVEKGEAIGLIGQNGCGKSTLLKLMTRIMYPDKGTITMEGRVSSLIELGAGFHLDMTGRENIYTNASIFGLTRREIDARVQEIIDFSEMWDYIDTPVRTYSSGMYMRLAFAVAINVDADILLIDEILAVGDASFQAKCFGRLREVKAAGTTIVIVSHSLNQIEQICERSIWIQDGIVSKTDNPYVVHPEYMAFMDESRKNTGKIGVNVVNQSKVGETKEEAEISSVRISTIEMLHEDGRVDNWFSIGERVLLKIFYEAIPEELDNPVIGLRLFRNDGTLCYGANTRNEHVEVALGKSGCIVFDIEKLNLIMGEYYFDIAIRSQDMFAYEYRAKAFEFAVTSSVEEDGIARLDHTWELHYDDICSENQ